MHFPAAAREIALGFFRQDQVLLDVADHTGDLQIVHVRGDDAQQLPDNGQIVHGLQNSIFSDTSAKQCATQLLPEPSCCLMRTVHKYACHLIVAV